MVCVLAEKNNPNRRTIALVNKQNYSLLQSALKIDDLVDPRLTTVSTILKHVHKGTIETVYTLLDGEYEFIEAEVLETSELISKSIKDSEILNTDVIYKQDITRVYLFQFHRVKFFSKGKDQTRVYLIFPRARLHASSNTAADLFDRKSIERRTKQNNRICPNTCPS